MNTKKIISILLFLLSASILSNTIKRYDKYDRKATHYVLNALMFEEFSDFERAITNYEAAYVNSGSNILLINQAIGEYYLGNNENALKIFENIPDLPTELAKYKYYQYILNEKPKGKEYKNKELLNELIELYSKEETKSNIKEGLYLLEKLLKNYKKYSEEKYFELFLQNALKREISDVYREYFSAVLFKFYSKVKVNEVKITEYVENLINKYNDKDYQKLLFVYNELIDSNRLELAEKVYKVLKKVRYLDPESYVFNYSLEKAKGNSQKARKIISTAEDNFPGVYFEMFSLQQYLDDKELKNAEIAFRNLIANNPDDIQIYQRYIMALIDNDLIDKAIEIYEIAIDKFPGQVVLQNNYAYLLIEQNRDLNKAYELSLNAIEQDPDNLSYLDTIAWIYYKQKKYEKADEYIDKAAGGKDVFIDPNSEELYDHYVKIKTKLKKYDDIENFKTNELTKSLHECVTSAMVLLK